MNRHLKRTFVFLALCAAVVLAPPLSRAAGTGRTITVASDTDLAEAMKNAQDGDTLLLGSCYVIDKTSKDLPWVIDKAVTFQGGEITCHMGGIILSKDVTFRNTKIGFTSYVRDSIMANGHTLTLENVTCLSGTRPINLFCGGFYTETETGCGDIPGTGGKIIIRGKTSLKTGEGTGNIYAGNLCLGGMDANTSAEHGPANTFAGNPEIVLEAEPGSELGRVYAGGAEQKIPEVALSGKVFLTDPVKYTVSGSVNVQLHASTIDYVNGLGANETHVTYTDTRETNYVTDTLGVYCISSLAVKSGHVSPAADSSFVEGASLAVAPGAKLGLEQLGSVTVGSFTGGGTLLLGEQQTLTVTDAVSGETCVQIGVFLSTSRPVENHTYIRAPQSIAASFTLIPPTGSPDLTFSRDDAGDWTVSGFDENPPIGSVRFDADSIFIDSESTEADLPLTVEGDDGNYAFLDFIPLDIRINGLSFERKTGQYEDSTGEIVEYIYYRCEAADLTIEVTANTLYVMGGDTMASAVIPDGSYFIEVTVPGACTGTGSPIAVSSLLTVGSPPDSGIIGGISPGAGPANTVRIYLAAPGGPVKAGTVMAAVYDTRGRLVSFGAVQVPAEGSTSVDVPVDRSGGTEVRAFLTNTMKPQCQSVSASLS